MSLVESDPSPPLTKAELLINNGTVARKARTATNKTETNANDT